jgi:hypothetical protein
MIKMPKSHAKEGRGAIINAIQWAHDHEEMSEDVTDYLKKVTEKATLEEVEIILAWMFIGAVADRLMQEIKAREMISHVLEIVGGGTESVVIDGTDPMEA